MWIRVCLNSFISFAVQPNEIKTISTELNTGKDKRSLDTIYRLLKKHEFVLFNLEEGIPYDHDFNKI